MYILRQFKTVIICRPLIFGQSMLSFGQATPIYLLVLRAQEVGNEPFWNKKEKLKNGTFLFILFFLESAD